MYLTFSELAKVCCGCWALGCLSAVAYSFWDVKPRKP
jgi:hypothetical protein